MQEKFTAAIVAALVMGMLSSTETPAQTQNLTVTKVAPSPPPFFLLREKDPRPGDPGAARPRPQDPPKPLVSASAALISLYCMHDYVTQGNMLQGYNISAGFERQRMSQASHVTGAQSARQSVTIKGSATVVDGDYGRLFLFANGSFAYYALVNGYNADRFLIDVMDKDRKSNSVALTIVPVDQRPAASIIAVDGVARSPDGKPHIFAAYAAKKDDTIHGGPGDDMLLGWSGADKLLGGPGNDVLFGEYGPDTLWGGPGADIFVASSFDVFGSYSGYHYDVVKDFEPHEGDVLFLGEAFAEKDVVRNNPLNFIRSRQTGAGTMIEVLVRPNATTEPAWRDVFLLENQRNVNLEALIESGNVLF
jgi:hypothetical protein